MPENVDLRALVRIAATSVPPMQRYHERQPRTQTHDGYTFLDLSGFDASFNAAVVIAEPDPEQFVAAAQDFFGNAGFDVLVESDMAPDFEARLVENGWIVDEEEPSMLLRPIPSLSTPSTDIEIRRVLTEAELDDFIDITKTGRRWIPSLAAALDPDVGLFVGYLDGAPVATSRINIFGELAEVNGVETLPAHRRHGYGTALTWAAVAAARASGCSAVALSASPMGYSVYLKMGFQPICIYRTYVQARQ